MKHARHTACEISYFLLSVTIYSGGQKKFKKRGRHGLWRYNDVVPQSIYWINRTLWNDRTCRDTYSDQKGLKRAGRGLVYGVNVIPHLSNYWIATSFSIELVETATLKSYSELGIFLRMEFSGSSFAIVWHLSQTVNHNPSVNMSTFFINGHGARHTCWTHVGGHAFS